MKRKNDSMIRETEERTEQDRFWMEGSDRADGMEEDAPFSWRERRMYTFGALKAALLIGLAYLVGLGLLIGLMVLVW